MDLRAQITKNNITKGCDGVFGVDNIKYTIKDIFKHEFTKENKKLVDDYFKENLSEEDFDNEKKRKKLFKKQPEKEVLLYNIYPNQDFLKEKTVKKYQKKDNFKPVMIFQFGTKLILFDGHHRTSSRILNDCRTVNAKIIQLR